MEDAGESEYPSIYAAPPVCRDAPELGTNGLAGTGQPVSRPPQKTRGLGHAAQSGEREHRAMRDGQSSLLPGSSCTSSGLVPRGAEWGKD